MNYADVLNRLQADLDALYIKLEEAEKKLDAVDALHTKAHQAADIGQARWLQRQIKWMDRAYRLHFRAHSRTLRRRVIEACGVGSDRDELEMRLIDFNLRVDMIAVDKRFWKDDGNH